MRPLLRVEGLRLSVPTGKLHLKHKTILHDVCFSVPEGARAAYLGPNGAGKTSTFRVLTRLVRPDAGRIHYRGHSFIPPACLGFLPEQPYFYRHLTPREVLSALARLAGLRQGVDARIAHWAERLGVAHVLDQRFAACSKGQMQRIGLVQALVHEPEFLLLDEPMSGLDPLGRELVADVLREVAARGTTILFSTHILSDAEELCDHVIVLHEGRVRYEGTMEALLASGRRMRLRYRAPKPFAAEAKALEKGVWEEVWPEEEAHKRLGEVMQRGAEVLLFAPQRRTLEEAFAELVGRGRP